MSKIMRITFSSKISKFSQLLLVSLFVVALSLSSHHCFAQCSEDSTSCDNTPDDGNSEKEAAPESDSITSFIPSAPTSDSMHSDATQLHLQVAGTLAAGVAMTGYFGTGCATKEPSPPGPPPGRIPDCIMAGLGVIQIGLSATSLLLAEEQEGITTDTPLPGPYGHDDDGNPSPDPNLVIETTKAQMEGSGIAVDETKGDICWNGKCFNPTDEEVTPESLANNGFSSKQSKMIMTAMSKASSAYEENLAKFETENNLEKGKNQDTFGLVNVGVNSAGGGGSLKGRRRTTSPSRNLSKFLSRMKKKGKKGKKNKHIALKKKYGKSPIGVGANNIFQIVHRRHEKLKKKRLFF